MFDMTGLFSSLIITLVVLLVIFLIGREFVCWYFKINEQLAVLKDIRTLLRENTTLLQDIEGKKEIDKPKEEKTQAPKRSPQDIYESGYCPECGSKLLNPFEEKCEDCQADLSEYKTKAMKNKLKENK